MILIIMMIYGSICEELSNSLSSTVVLYDGTTFIAQNTNITFTVGMNVSLPNYQVFFGISGFEGEDQLFNELF